MPRSSRPIPFSMTPHIFNTRSRWFLTVLFILFTFSNLFSQDFRTAHDGIEYAQVDHKIGSDPVKINLLRLDLKKVRLDVHHAMDAAIGTEKTSSIATRHGAVAAINAGFFRLDKSVFLGDAVGVLQIDGKLLSENVNSRVALGIVNGEKKTEVAFGHLDSKLMLFLGIDTSYEISGINRQPKSGETIIFTPDFGPTTRTDESVTEFIVQLPNKGSKKGNVIETRKNKGNSTIPANGFVISASGEKAVDIESFISKYLNLTSWSTQHISSHPQFREFISKAEDIIAGVPQLIKNGKIDITWEQEKSSKAFVETRHPRTAVAKLKDGKFLMITVDGRQPGVSVGMNLYELADYLLSLGAVDAMNLDGGGSTTMFLDGKVVSKPSDKEGERKVSDAILVSLRKGKPTRK